MTMRGVKFECVSPLYFHSGTYISHRSKIIFTGVKVDCCYFMDAPLHSPPKKVVERTQFGELHLIGDWD